jgi:exonuclease VII small subunit
MTNISNVNADANPFQIPAAQPDKIDYATQYRILLDIVNRLKRGSAGDLDSLAELFRTGLAAYGACRSRLDAIREEIDQELARLAPQPSTDFS